MNRSAPGEHGFTLLELLVVSALISILLSVAVPNFRDALYTDQLKSSARKIVFLIKDVRQKAVREQQPYLLYFDRAGREIRVEQDRPKGQGDGVEDPEKAITLVLPDSVHVTDLITASSGRLIGNDSALWISKQGYMDKTAIHLQDDSDGIMTLIFSPFLGSIQVFDSYIDLD